MVVALLAGYAAVLIGTRDRWLTGTPVERATAVFAPQPRDGTTPDDDELTEAGQRLAARVSALGGTDVDVTTDSDGVTIAATGVDVDDLESLAAQGQLNLRPVIHVIPATSSGSPTPAPPKPDSAQRIADEKALRQSTEQNIQLLGLQFQATRCGDADVLAGLDDPTLPLVTCASDGKQVYLLGPALIDGADVDSASARYDDTAGQYVVELVFTESGAKTWAEFTEEHIGTQVAFTADTAVVSAPQIMEAIPGGRTQITGQFSKSDAEDFARVVARGGLPFPMTVESSGTETAFTKPSTPWRIGLLAAGVVLAALTVGAVVLVAARRRVR